MAKILKVSPLRSKPGRPPKSDKKTMTSKKSTKSMKGC